MPIRARDRPDRALETPEPDATGQSVGSVGTESARARSYRSVECGVLTGSASRRTLEPQSPTDVRDQVSVDGPVDRRPDRDYPRRVQALEGGEVAPLDGVESVVSRNLGVW